MWYRNKLVLTWGWQAKESHKPESHWIIRGWDVADSSQQSTSNWSDLNQKLDKSGERYKDKRCTLPWSLPMWHYSSSITCEENMKMCILHKGKKLLHAAVARSASRPLPNASQHAQNTYRLTLSVWRWHTISRVPWSTIRCYLLVYVAILFSNWTDEIIGVRHWTSSLVAKQAILF